MNYKLKNEILLTWVHLFTRPIKVIEGTGANYTPPLKYFLFIGGISVFINYTIEQLVDSSGTFDSDWLSGNMRIFYSAQESFYENFSVVTELIFAIPTMALGIIIFFPKLGREILLNICLFLGAQSMFLLYLSEFIERNFELPISNIKLPLVSLYLLPIMFVIMPGKKIIKLIKIFFAILFMWVFYEYIMIPTESYLYSHIFHHEKLKYSYPDYTTVVTESLSELGPHENFSFDDSKIFASHVPPSTILQFLFQNKVVSKSFLNRVLFVGATDSIQIFTEEQNNTSLRQLVRFDYSSRNLNLIKKTTYQQEYWTVNAVTKMPSNSYLSAGALKLNGEIISVISKIIGDSLISYPFMELKGSRFSKIHLLNDSILILTSYKLENESFFEFSLHLINVGDDLKLRDSKIIYQKKSNYDPPEVPNLKVVNNRIIAWYPLANDTSVNTILQAYNYDLSLSFKQNLNLGGDLTEINDIKYFNDKYYFIGSIVVLLKSNLSFKGKKEFAFLFSTNKNGDILTSNYFHSYFGTHLMPIDLEITEDRFIIIGHERAPKLLLWNKENLVSFEIE